MSWIITGTQKLDPDAAIYIDRVEAADSQSLEEGVKSAYNTFVSGCKADGIWDAIKASCILAGARTLDGALVPLVGTAPRNYNFVAGDYNRETGLAGDVSTKYLDSNRNNNADPQNDKHVSVFIQDRGSAASGARYIAAGDSSGNDTFINNLNSSSIIHNINASSYNATTYSGTGFAGITINSSTAYVARINSSNQTFNRTSGIPRSENIGLFARGTGAGPYSNGRLSFYSIGESLDLALLDARVTTLMSDLAAAIV